MPSTILPATPVRSDVVGVETAPRPTPRPLGPPFQEVLAGGARAFVRGATAAARTLPGSPLMAVALRGGLSPELGVVPSRNAGGPMTLPSSDPVVTPTDPTGGTAASAGDPGIGNTLAQEAQMNLYYLQIQEEVNAQNRTFSTLSNVLEVEHNTAKTAIGNIH